MYQPMAEEAERSLEPCTAPGHAVFGCDAVLARQPAPVWSRVTVSCVVFALVGTAAYLLTGVIAAVTWGGLGIGDAIDVLALPPRGRWSDATDGVVPSGTAWFLLPTLVTVELFIAFWTLWWWTILALLSYAWITCVANLVHVVLVGLWVTCVPAHCNRCNGTTRSPSMWT